MYFKLRSLMTLVLPSRIIVFQPHRNTTIAQAIAVTDPYNIEAEESPRKAMWINADPSKLIKTRSPRVVLIGKNPLRLTVGLMISKTVNRANPVAIDTKKIAVGRVQAIQLTRVSPR